MPGKEIQTKNYWDKGSSIIVILISVCIGVVGWMITEVVNLQGEIVKLNASGFTFKQAKEISDRVIVLETRGIILDDLIKEIRENKELTIKINNQMIKILVKMEIYDQ
jgi:hypothetical protein